MLLKFETRELAKDGKAKGAKTGGFVGIRPNQIMYVYATSLRCPTTAQAITKVVCPYKLTFYVIGEYDEILKRVNLALSQNTALSVEV